MKTVADIFGASENAPKEETTKKKTVADIFGTSNQETTQTEKKSVSDIFGSSQENETSTLNTNKIAELEKRKSNLEVANSRTIGNPYASEIESINNEINQLKAEQANKDYASTMEGYKNVTEPLISQQTIKSANGNQSVPVGEAAMRNFASQGNTMQDYMNRQKANIAQQTIDYATDPTNSKTKTDNFLGTTSANYRIGRMGMDEASAWAKAADTRIDEQKEFAKTIGKVAEQYAIKNNDALETSTNLERIIASNAQYVPQLLDQLGYQAVGAMISSSLGLGKKVGAVAGSGLYSFRTMQGSAFKALSELTDEETAINMARDEAFISSIIEMGDTAIDLTLYGIIPGLDKILGGRGKKILSSAEKTAIGLMFSQLKAVADKNAYLKFLGKLAAYGINIGQESLEEQSQESVSMMNEQRAKEGGKSGVLDLLKRTIGNDDSPFKQYYLDKLGFKDSNLSEEDYNRIKEAGQGGADVALGMGALGFGASKVVNKVGDAVENNRSQKEVGKDIRENKTVADIFGEAKSMEGTKAQKLANSLNEESVSDRQLGKLSQQIQKQRLTSENKEQTQANLGNKAEGYTTQNSNEKSVARGLVRNEASKKISARTTRILDKVGRLLNLDIILDENMENSDNAEIQGNTIRISSKAKNPLSVILFHEMTHRFETMFPTEYKKLSDIVLKDMQANNDTSKVINEVLGKAYNFENNDERNSEIVAHYIENLATNPTEFEKLIGIDRTLAQKIFDFVSDYFRRVEIGWNEGLGDSDSSFLMGNLYENGNWKEALDTWEGMLKKTSNKETPNSKESKPKQSKKLSYDKEVEDQKTSKNIKESTNSQASKATDEVAISLPKIKTELNAKDINSDYVGNFVPYKSNEVKKSKTLYSEPSYKQRFKYTKSDGFTGIVEKEKKSGREVLKETCEKYGKDFKKYDEFLTKLADFMDEAQVKYKFVGLNDVENAKIVYNERTNQIVLSAMVKNGEYPVNFDLTKICKRRIPLSNFINDLSKAKGKNGGDTMLDEVSLTSENLLKINELLRDAGVDTACVGCFVESRRYNINDWANNFINIWNDEVIKANKDAEYFNFVNGDVNVEDLSKDEISKLNDELEQARADQEVEKKKKRARAKAYKEEQAKKGISVRDDDPLGKSKLTIEEEMRILIRNTPTLQKKLKIGDIITEEGRTKLHREFPEVDSLLTRQWGSNTPKGVEVFAPYNNEVELLPEMVGEQTLQEYLASIGGARSQSFSDFIMSHLFDVIQKTAGFASRDATAHTYTKVPARAWLTGQTGEKINLSVMFNIDPKLDPKYAGLTMKNGNLEYFIGDKATSEQQLKETGKATYVQSFPFDEAIKLQTTEGYSSNCGIIGVGHGWLHINMMLGDKNIRYIIGYHSSGMPSEIAIATNIGYSADYQPVQNTLKVLGIAKVTNKGKNGYLHSLPSYATWSKGTKSTTNIIDPILTAQYKKIMAEGNGRKTMEKLLDFLDKHDLTFTTQTAQNGHGSFPLYEDLAKTKDPRKTSDNYINWCLKQGYMPVFYEFAANDNYYKFVYDFNVYDCITEKYAPQKPVEMKFPSNFFELADKFMNEYNEEQKDYEGKRESIRDKGYELLTKKSKVLDSDGNNLSNGQVTFFKDSKARDTNGKLIKMYHGTWNFGFSIFDAGYSDDGLSLFFTDNLDTAKTYSLSKDEARAVSKDNNYIQNAKDSSIESIAEEVTRTHIDGIKKAEVIHDEKGRTYVYVDFYNARKSFPSHGKYEAYSESYFRQFHNPFKRGVYSVYLNLTNPLIVDAKGNNWNKLFGIENGKYDSVSSDGVLTTRNLTKYAKDNGYDGVIFKNIVDNSSNSKEVSTVMTAFNSNQVKSTDNLNPTEDPDIRYSKTLNLSDEDTESLYNAKAEMNANKASEQAIDNAYASVKSLMEDLKQQVKDGTVQYQDYKMVEDAYKEIIRLEKQKAKEDQKLKDMDKAERKEYQDFWKKELDKADAKLDKEMSKLKLQELEEKYQQQIKGARERRKRTQESQELLRALKQLKQLRKKSSPDFQAQIDDIIGDINLFGTSVLKEGYTRSDGVKVRGEIDLKNLLDELEQKELDDNFIKDSAYKEYKSWVERFQKKQIADMSLEEIEKLIESATSLRHQILSYNKTVGETKDRLMSFVAHNVANEIESSKDRKLGKIANFKLETLRPRTLFRQLSNYTNGSLEGMYDELENGQTKYIDYTMKSTTPFDKFIEKHPEAKKWSNETIEVQLGDKKVKINKMMRISLYMHLQNDDNMAHIQRGGIVIPNLELLNKGQIKDAYAEGKGTRVKVTKENIRDLVSNMSPLEKEFADLLKQHFRNAQISINQTSMALDGFEKATVDNYFPIVSDKDFLSTTMGDMVRDFRLENMGSLKERQVGSSNPIILEDANNVLIRQIESIGRYVGFAVPLRNFQTLYNFHVGDGRTIKGIIRSKASNYNDYIEKLISQVNGNREKGTGFSAISGNYASAVLNFNLSVALSQTASYPTAAAVLGEKALRKGLAMGKVDIDKMAEYTPLYWYRTKGYINDSLAATKDASTFVQKLPGTKWIQSMDLLTTRTLWNASQAWVQDNTTLAKDSEAYWQKVAEMYNKVIYETQPNYTVLNRPGVLRSDNELTRQLFMFRTQSYQNWNMLYDAWGEMVAKKGTSQEGMARKKAFQTATTLLVANAVFTAFKNLVLMARHKKDEDWYDEDGDLNVLKWLMDNYFSNMAGSIPLGSELLEAINIGNSNYDTFTVPALDAINSLISGYQVFEKDIYEAIKSGTPIVYFRRNRADMMKDIWSLSKKISQFAGIPLANVVKYIGGVMSWFMPEVTTSISNTIDPVNKNDIAFRHEFDLYMKNTLGFTNDNLYNLYQKAGSMVLPTFDASNSSYGLNVAQQYDVEEEYKKIVKSIFNTMFKMQSFKSLNSDQQAHCVVNVYSYAKEMALGTEDKDYPKTKWIIEAKSSPSSYIINKNKNYKK